MTSKGARDVPLWDLHLSAASGSLFIQVHTVFTLQALGQLFGPSGLDA